MALALARYQTTDSRFFGIGEGDADSGSPLNYYTVDDGRLQNISAEYSAEINATLNRLQHEGKFRHYTALRHGHFRHVSFAARAE